MNWLRAVIAIPADRTAGGAIEATVRVPREEVPAFDRDPFAWLVTHGSDYPCALAVALVGSPDAFRSIVRAVHRGAGRLQVFRNGGDA